MDTDVILRRFEEPDETREAQTLEATPDRPWTMDYRPWTK